MNEEQYEKQILRTFDVFGQALYLALRQAQNPAEGGLNALRQQWRNVGKEVIKLAKEDIDA